MTLQELSQYYKLRERLKRDEEILESLRAAACPGAQNLSGMPHAPGVRDKVADMTERIRYLKEEIGRAEAAVTEFVESIENDQTRMIFRLRFLRCLTWGEVAAVIGGRNTEDGVKSACYRYLSS